MPIPKPGETEDQQNFVRRCMGDEVMVKEFPDKSQRYAICIKQWREKGK